MRGTTFGQGGTRQPAQLGTPGPLGRALAGLGTFGFSELGFAAARNRARREQEQEAIRNEQLQEIARVQSGQSIPAFAREEFTPEEIRGQQLRQLAAIGGPEAFAASQQFVSTPQTEFQRQKFAFEQEKFGAEQERQAKQRSLDERKFGLDERKFALEVDEAEKEAEQGLVDKDVFKVSSKLRDEFRGLSKKFVIQRDAFSTIQASAEDPSPAGDIALILSFMKVLDPPSTIREGEFATAENAGSVPERVRAMYNKVKAGTRLSQEQRDDFVNRGTKLFKKGQAQHQKRIGEYRRISNIVGVPDDLVIVDFGLAEQEALQEQEGQQTPSPTGTQQLAPQAGQVLLFDAQGNLVQ